MLPFLDLLSYFYVFDFILKLFSSKLVVYLSFSTAYGITNLEEKTNSDWLFNLQ